MIRFLRTLLPSTPRRPSHRRHQPARQLPQPPAAQRVAALVPVLLTQFLSCPLPAQGETASPTPSPPSPATPPPAGDAQDPNAASSAPDVLQFNGTKWRASDNDRFVARFEKYLNTPEENSEDEQNHRRILNQIATLLEPTSVNSQSISTAFRLLTRATQFSGDSRLSDTLANGIYEIWQTKRSNAQLQEANRILEEERRALESSMIAAAKAGNRPGAGIQQAGRASKIFQKDTKIATNTALGQLSELQSKVSYQGLLVQLLLQRRFHHLLIGTRFYRAIFDDSDSRLHTMGSASSPLAGRSGAPPSVSLLETLAKESIQDVQSGVAAFHQHFEKGELRNATEKLREALLIGEFLPELRTLALEQKRKILAYFQKTLRLQTALDTKDYALAGELLDAKDGLQKLAVDFDAGPARAAIESAHAAAGLALHKAQAALQEGDKVLFEKRLSEAAQFWPNNPALQALTTRGFQQADEQAVALRELEDLVSRNDFRRIQEHAAQFLAAVQFASGEKQSKLREMLELSKTVESTLGLAAEMDQQGNAAGAWEKVYFLGKTVPGEVRLSAATAQYAERAVPFIEAIRKAQKLQNDAQLAQSVAWYLKAQKILPTSVLARESLEILCPRLLEDLK
jgi:hypothetical protein